MIGPRSSCPPAVRLAATRGVRLLLLVAATATAAAAAAQEPDYEAIWSQGTGFDAFLESVERQATAWQDNYEHGTPDEATVARAAGLDASKLRLLVVAEDWCSDSVDTIPYLARAVETIDGLEMRIVDSDAGAGVMAVHRTPDDRGATPTVVLLDASGAAVGVWVERPAELQEWFLANRDGLRRRELLDQKHAWYAEDHGHSTVNEILDLIESAGRRRSPPDDGHTPTTIDGAEDELLP